MCVHSFLYIYIFYKFTNIALKVLLQRVWDLQKVCKTFVFVEKSAVFGCFWCFLTSKKRQKECDFDA